MNVAQADNGIGRIPEGWVIHGILDPATIQVYRSTVINTVGAAPYISEPL